MLIWNQWRIYIDKFRPPLGPIVIVFMQFSAKLWSYPYRLFQKRWNTHHKRQKMFRWCIALHKLDLLVPVGHTWNIKLILSLQFLTFITLLGFWNMDCGNNFKQNKEEENIWIFLPVRNKYVFFQRSIVWSSNYNNFFHYSLKLGR